MLRQAENKIRIEGILSEINLKYNSYVRDGKTVDSIGGSIKVLVNQEVNGENVELIIPVYMFSPKYTNMGKLNPSYESIEKVMKEFTSIASGAGLAGADKVRITTGNVRMNEFLSLVLMLLLFLRLWVIFVQRLLGALNLQFLL